MAQTLKIEPTSSVDKDGNLSITISLTPNERKYMLNEILSIEDWVSDAIAGKINKCKKRMMNEWNPKLMPSFTDDEVWLDMVTSRPDYENRIKKAEKSKK